MLWEVGTDLPTLLTNIQLIAGVPAILATLLGVSLYDILVDMWTHVEACGIIEHIGTVKAKNVWRVARE